MCPPHIPGAHEAHGYVTSSDTQNDSIVHSTHAAKTLGASGVHGFALHSVMGNADVEKHIRGEDAFRRPHSTTVQGRPWQVKGGHRLPSREGDPCLVNPPTNQ